MNPKRISIRFTVMFNLALIATLMALSLVGTAGVKAAIPDWTPAPSAEGVVSINASLPPANQVTLVGQYGGGVKSVAANGNYAYVADGTRLVILDKTNPSAPVVSGKTVLSTEMLRDVAVSSDGNRAYVAAGNLGLRVINTASKTAPSETGFYAWSAEVTRVVTVSNDYVFAIDSSNMKIWVISVQNPSAPYLAGSSATLSGVPRALAVAGNFAYVVNADDRLQQLNIAGANITSPVITASFLLSPGPNPLTGLVDIAVDNSGANPNAYVIGNEGILRINVDTLAKTAFKSPGYKPRAVSLDATDGSVYLALEDYGLQALSLDLATIKGTFTSSPPYTLIDVVKSGGYLYTVDYDNGLRVVTLPVSWTPIPYILSQASIYHSFIASDVTLMGNYAYLASGDAGLNILSVSAPANPSYIGGYSSTGQATGVRINNNKAYLAEVDAGSNGGLQIFNVTNPAFPAPIGGPVTVNGNSTAGIHINSNYAYISANTAGMQVFSLEPSVIPVAVFDLGGTPAGWVYDVAKSGNFAFLAYGSRGLRIVDVPASPSGNLNPRGSFDTPGDARGVSVDGNYAYVADGSAGLQIINVADKDNPFYVGSAPMVEGEAQDVFISGTKAFIAAGTGGLRVVDISVPSSPVEVGYYNTPGFATELEVVGNLIYLADGSGGLTVLQYSTTPPPGPYTVSGKVYINGTQTGLSGTTLTSSFGATAVSDANGNYALVGASAGAYTVTASLTGYSCSPTVLSGTAPADVLNKDFYCSPVPVGQYSISGKVTNSGTSNPIAGVLISDGTHTAATDASGNYSLSGLPAGSYTIAASMSGYTFSASFSNPVVITNADQNGKNFSGTQGTGGDYSISGRITDASQNPIASVVVSDGTRTATTDSGGNYTINGVPYGSYLVVPLKSGFSFSPASLSVAVPPSASGRDFKATINPPYTVSGRITETNNNPVASVTLTDGNGHTTSTDSNGNYILTGLPAGTYSITPAKSGFTFTPATLIGSVPPNAINKNFSAILAATYTISGRVADQNNAAIPDVTVMDAGGRSAITNSNGDYSITNVPSGSYTISASKGGFIFSPAELKGSVPPNGTGQNFTGIQVGTITPSPETPTPTETPVTPTPSGTPATATPTGSPIPGTYSISGTVKNEASVFLSGVTVSDGKGHSTLTDANGKYTISGLASGTFTITPNRTGYVCTPSNRQVSLPPNATADFICSQFGSIITGSVLDGHASPIAGVALSDGQGHTAISGSDGKYSISGLTPGTYTITPSKSEHIFEPANRTVIVPPGAVNVNFYGTSGVVDVIVNGNFEKAEAWVMPYDRAGYSIDTGMAVTLEMSPSPQAETLQREAVAGYSSQEVHSGNRSMRVGILDPAKNVLSYSTGRQKVFIPATAKCATMRFWLYPRSEISTDSADFQMVSILDENLGQIQRVLTQRSDKRAWDFYDFDLDLNKVKGKWIWVYFGVFNDGHNSVMAEYVDDVSLFICSKNIPPLPQMTPTPTVLPQ